MKRKAQEASKAGTAPRVPSLQSGARGLGTVFGGRRLYQARTVNEHVSVFNMSSYRSRDIKLVLERSLAREQMYFLLPECSLRSPPRHRAREAAVTTSPTLHIMAGGARPPVPVPLTPLRHGKALGLDGRAE